jgi:hypothetical protein
VVDEGIMASNILKRAELYNATDPVGLPNYELSRSELQVVQGTREGAVTVPALSYICFEADIKFPFYCKDFMLRVSSNTAIAAAYFRSVDYRDWVPLEVVRVADNFTVDFNKTIPDHAQMVYQFRVMYANLTQGSSQVYGAELLTVDYPIDFDYNRFSVVASSRENSPIRITNKSVQQTEKDIRVLPIFSDNYDVDSVYMLTASGKSDSDRYHLQRGYRIPEDAPWEAGWVSAQVIGTVESGKVTNGAFNTSTVNFVPTMSGSNAPSPFVVSASSQWGPYAGWYAFDAVLVGADRAWISATTCPAWLSIDVGSPKILNKYRFYLYDGTNNYSFAPNNWYFQGSLDGSSWTNLHAVTGAVDQSVYVNWWSPWYSFVGSSYRYYRIYVTNIHAAGDNLVAITKFELVEAQDSEDPDALFLYRDSLQITNREITTSGTAVSGTWTSPVIYVPDEDLISMYVYLEDTRDDSYLGTDLQRVDNIVEARSSDTPPVPNFLVSSWTQRLYTDAGYQDELKLPARRPDFVSYQSIPEAQSSFWVPARFKGACGGPDVQYVSPCPFVLGRSKRMYLKGDGTVLAEAPKEGDDSTVWEYGHRGYQLGIPVKEYGDINYYWNAGHFVNLMGSFIPYKTGSCTMDHVAAPAKWHHMTFTSEDDSSKWAMGKDASDKIINIMPYIYHFSKTRYCFGCAQEELTFEPLGGYTMAVDTHPNEWMSVSAILYPWSITQDKYMCLYYTHLRNFWASESKILGIYGIGREPCDEGLAVCKRLDGDGFWVHVGYLHRLLDKYDMDGNLVYSNRANYGFNSIRETKDPAGLWAVRNDSIYWYSATDEGETEEVFSITSPAFKYLQVGDIDDNNNLWVVDRDTSTVYRINFANREIDYELERPFTVGVWPHPRDGTAYLYTSFNPGTFSTAIHKVAVDDPYGYAELISALPELPISDYSGVQLQGRSMLSYVRAAEHDPVWGTADDMSLEWQRYPNAALTLPGGKYKQFRVTLNRSSSEVSSPRLRKIRIPKSLLLSKVPYDNYGEVYVNPHLRYNKQYGHFDTELVVWWPH